MPPFQDVRPEETIARLEAELADAHARREQAERERDHALAQRDEFKRLLDTIPANIGTGHGPDLVYTYLNQYARETLGDRDLIGMTAVEAFPDLAAQGFLELAQSVMTTQVPWIGRAVPAHKVGPDGHVHTRYFDLNYLPIHDAKGQVNGLLSFSYDVTEMVGAKQQHEQSERDLQEANRELEEQRTELARLNDELRDRNAHVKAVVAERTRQLLALNEDLHQQTQMLERLLAHVPSAIAYRDRHMVYQFVNRLYAEGQGLGLAPEEYPGKQLKDLLPDAVDAWQGAALEAVQSKRPVTVTGDRFLRPDGLGGVELTYWEGTYVPIFDAAGDVDGVLALARDVTEQVLLERQMTQQTELTDRMFASAPAGIAYLDGDLVYRRVNPSYARLIDMTVEQIVDKSIHEVFPGATDQFEPIMREVMATGRPFHTTNFEFRFMLDGEEKVTFWDFTYQPLKDASGKTGIMIIEIEVSDRQDKMRLQTEQIARLEELDRYKDEFLSVVSHELRTPLNFITGFTSLLEDEVAGPLNAEQHEYAGKIQQGADRMLHLVNDLLDVAKLQSGTFDLSAETTDYGALLSEAVASLQPLAHAKDLLLETDLAVEALLYIDAARIVQVVTNLVGNAIKFTEPGGRIRLRSYRRGDEIVTEVSDTGCGIAPADQGKLFMRFQQLDMSSTRKVGGTGLGLAITKALVEAHAGRVGLDSEPGEGSTFWFTLPLSS